MNIESRWSEVADAEQTILTRANTFKEEARK